MAYGTLGRQGPTGKVAYGTFGALGLQSSISHFARRPPFFCKRLILLSKTNTFHQKHTFHKKQGICGGGANGQSGLWNFGAVRACLGADGMLETGGGFTFFTLSQYTCHIYVWMSACSLPVWSGRPYHDTSRCALLRICLP